MVVLTTKICCVRCDDSIQKLHSLAWEKSFAHGLDHSIGRLDNLCL